MHAYPPELYRKSRFPVYHPLPDSVAATRPDFVKHALGPQPTVNTILGLDANCVPDEALYLKRVANSPYRSSASAHPSALARVGMSATSARIPASPPLLPPAQVGYNELSGPHPMGTVHLPSCTSPCLVRLRNPNADRCTRCLINNPVLVGS